MFGLTVITIGLPCSHLLTRAPRPSTRLMSRSDGGWGLAARNRIGTLQHMGRRQRWSSQRYPMVTASPSSSSTTDILLALISRVGGALGPIMPSLRTAVAYPMATASTGMTLAMISSRLPMTTMSP